MPEITLDLDGVREDHNLDGCFMPNRAVSFDRRFVKLGDDIGHGRTTATNDSAGDKPVRFLHRESPRKTVVVIARRRRIVEVRT